MPKDPSLLEQLAALPTMKRKALIVLWARLFDKPPNPALRREVLVPIIAYRLQEVAYGGLKPSLEKRLHAVARNSSDIRATASVLHPKPGTRFVREWHGKLHEVSVQTGGYEYNYRTYKSLSEIAREITGTRWSGPAFFGLRNRKTERAA